MVMTRATGAPRFPLSWTSDLMVIIGFDFDDLTSNEPEIVQVLNNFKFMSSNTLIIIDQGDDSVIH